MSNENINGNGKTFKLNTTTCALVIQLIVFAFFFGSLWTKADNLNTTVSNLDDKISNFQHDVQEQITAQITDRLEVHTRLTKLELQVFGE